MKKTIMPIMAAILMAFGFSSCEHQTMETMEVVIHPEDWVTTQAGLQDGYYICTVGWDALTERVVDYGHVNAYLVENGRQNPLPYVYPIDYSTYDENGNLVGNPVYVTENLRYDYGYGRITFVMQDFDFEMPAGTIPAMTFRVVAVGD